MGKEYNTSGEGKEYECFCQNFHEIFQKINENFSQISTLQNLQYLIFFIASEKYEENNIALKKIESDKSSEFIDINESIDKILQLGSELGFEVDKNISMAAEYKIAALWKNKIANLVITYAFEVINTNTNISKTAKKISEITRIDPSIQKVIVVSRVRHYEALKEKLQENNISKNFVSHFNINDLEKALSHLEGLKEILDEIGLLKFNT